MGCAIEDLESGFLKQGVIDIVPQQHARGGRERGQRSQRGDAGNAELLLRRQFGELAELLRIVERDASITHSVLMAALKRVTCVAQQERARDHQRCSGRGSILERTAQHDSNGHLGVLLFECAIFRPGGANYLVDRPAIPGGQRLRRLRSAGQVRAVPRCVVRVVHRNFRQEPWPPAAQE